MVKCYRNVNFEEITDITEPSIEKNNKFWLVWGIFSDYIKQIINMAEWTKVNCDLVDILQIDKKSIM